MSPGSPIIPRGGPQVVGSYLEEVESGWVMTSGGGLALIWNILIRFVGSLFRNLVTKSLKSESHSFGISGLHHQLIHSLGKGESGLTAVSGQHRIGR